MVSALSVFKSAKLVWKFGFGGVFGSGGVVWKAGVRCDCFVFVWVYEKGRLAVSSSKA